MMPFPAPAQSRPSRSTSRVGKWVAAGARPLPLALMVLALLLVFSVVVRGSVQRGQMLNQQMADMSSRCDGAAKRSRAPDCMAASGSTRNPARLPSPAVAAATR